LCYVCYVCTTRRHREQLSSREPNPFFTLNPNLFWKPNPNPKSCRAAVATVASPPPQTAGATRLVGEAPAPVLSNWNKSYFFTPAKYVEPTTVDEIQAVRVAIVPCGVSARKGLLPIYAGYPSLETSALGSWQGALGTVLSAALRSVCCALTTCT